MNYVNSNGTKIAYQVRGSGEPLVLLMGFGADGSLWEKHVEMYQRHFKCILIDNRGVGSSDQPKGPYTTRMMAEDAVVVMEHAGIEHARVAGISMGGAIAQELAINFPQKVQSLALISTWSQFNEHTSAVYENLKKIRLACKPETFTELIQLWIFAPLYYGLNLEDLKGAQLAASNNSNHQSREGFEGQLDACIGHNTSSRLSEIKIPTLITVGKLDIFTPLHYSEILQKGIQGSVMECFTSGGHAHHWEDLIRFNEITTNFFLNN